MGENIKHLVLYNAFGDENMIGVAMINRESGNCKCPFGKSSKLLMVQVQIDDKTDWC